MVKRMPLRAGYFNEIMRLLKVSVEMFTFVR